MLLACAGCGGVLDPKGKRADQTATLAWILFAIAAAVFVLIVVLLLLAVFRSRRGPLSADTPEPDRAERPAEFLTMFGAAFPVVVLAVVLLVSLGPLGSQASSAPNALTVRIVGHRWWWEIEYPELGIKTANELHLPVAQKVNLELTSADVVHSFWVPQLSGKTDLIPGQVNKMWIEAGSAGTYEGSCAEYCGVGHTNMDMLVVADQQNDFDAWVKGQQAVPPVPVSDPMLEGMQVFLGSACVYCHRIAGTNASSGFGPDLTHLASRRELGAGVVPNTVGNLAGWIVDSQHLKPGNAMPAMNLDGKELQDLLAYLESLT